ncbi:MAG: insulinase family protein, partial [Pseudomonadota bacterium]
TGARCEHLASHLQVFGRPLSTEEIVRNVDAVDEAAVKRVLTRLLASRPTVTALGPVSKLEEFDAISARLH